MVRPGLRYRFELLTRYILETMKARLFGVGARHQFVAATNFSSSSKSRSKLDDDLPLFNPPNSPTPSFSLPPPPKTFFQKKPLMIKIPPKSSNLLETLGAITAASIIDDEIVCKPYSTPQQLLIPSASGLKLLDLFEKFDEKNANHVGESTSSENSSVDLTVSSSQRKRTQMDTGGTYSSSSSDSENDNAYEKMNQLDNLGRKIVVKKKGKNRLRSMRQLAANHNTMNVNSRFSIMMRHLKTMGEGVGERAPVPVVSSCEASNS